MLRWDESTYSRSNGPLVILRGELTGRTSTDREFVRTAAGEGIWVLESIVAQVRLNDLSPSHCSRSEVGELDKR